MSNIWTDIKPLDVNSLIDELLICSSERSRVGIILANERQKREMICQFAVESARPRSHDKTNVPWVANVANSTIDFNNGSTIQFISQNQDIHGMVFDRILCDIYTDPEKVLMIYLDVVKRARGTNNSELCGGISDTKQNDLLADINDDSFETEAWLNRFPVRTN